MATLKLKGWEGVAPLNGLPPPPHLGPNGTDIADQNNGECTGMCCTLDCKTGPCISSMSVNVDDQVVEDDVEDLDDLENMKVRTMRRTRAENARRARRRREHWCSAQCKSRWHKIWGQQCGNHACDTGDPNESRACARCTEGLCSAFDRTELGGKV